MFGVNGSDDALQYNYGYERIPENWYRRPIDYGLVDLNLDILGFVAQYPELARLVLSKFFDTTILPNHRLTVSVGISVL